MLNKKQTIPHMARNEPMVANGSTVFSKIGMKIYSTNLTFHRAVNYRQAKMLTVENIDLLGGGPRAAVSYFCANGVSTFIVLSLYINIYCHRSSAFVELFAKSLLILLVPLYCPGKYITNPPNKGIS